jgi:GAF domain-containing protein
MSVDEQAPRWVREHGTLHVPDVNEPNDVQIANSSGSRTHLFVPLRQKGEFIGTLSARRTEVRPFTPAQIKLLETFADQAVIAIENVRLFNELKESLEQQTATSEILSVIASSPTDIQPVLDVVAENAARLCDASDGVIGRPEGDKLRIVAKYGAMLSPEALPLTRDFPAGRAVLDGQTIHIHDILAEIETEYPDARVPQQLTGTRTALNVPLMREGVAVGAIMIRRTEVRPFSDKQIALLKTFADQAVIAIENVRLFKELEERNRQLTESLEQQTATGEILRVIASSPTDIQPVLNVVAENAARLCDATDAVIHRIDGDKLRSWLISGRCRHGVRTSLQWIATLYPAEPWLTDEPFTFMTSRQNQKTTSRRRSLEVSAFGRCFPRRYCAREFPSGRFISAAWRSARSPKSRSNCLKPLQLRL